MKDCIFCKIIKGEIPSSKVYEDDNVYVFLDIAPVKPGHMLVVAKEHHEYIETMPEKHLCEVMKVVKKMGKAIKDGLGVEGYNIMQNNGAVAGQVIFHVHFHIIPRSKDDGLKSWMHRSYNEGEEKSVLSKIKCALNN